MSNEKDIKKDELTIEELNYFKNRIPIDMRVLLGCFIAFIICGIFLAAVLSLIQLMMIILLFYTYYLDY